jgi:hypothetical protein
MADPAGIPRSRGGLSGVLLILLGAWGALAPLVGPYFHFAYTPDQAWKINTGRLWLEIAPGAAAVLGGLIVASTRSRPAGVLGGLLAALGGAWLVTGTAITAQFVKDGSINPGQPVGTTSLHIFEVGMAFFIGTGLLIVFFAALAMGRFAVGGAAVSSAAWDGGTEADSFPSGPDHYQTQEQYATGTDQYPATPGSFGPASSQPVTTADQPTTAAPQDLFGRPQAQQQFSSPAGQFPPPSTSPFPASPSPFPPAGEPGSTES